VLVVEDDPELRRQLARGLGEEGFAVLVATDAAAGAAP
jgi:DNA-binding response OmpR family regulator